MPTIPQMKAELSKAWMGRLCKRIVSLGFAGVSPAERGFAAIWMLEAEVDNGGFAQYMFNDYGDEAAVARQALATIGAVATLAVFDDSLALLPRRTPAGDRNARQGQLDRLAKKHGEWKFDAMLGKLEKRFYKTEDDLLKHMYAFAKANGWVKTR